MKSKKYKLKEEYKEIMLLMSLSSNELDLLSRQLFDVTNEYEYFLSKKQFYELGVLSSENRFRYNIRLMKYIYILKHDPRPGDLESINDFLNSFYSFQNKFDIIGKSLILSKQKFLEIRNRYNNNNDYVSVKDLDIFFAPFNIPSFFNSDNFEFYNYYDFYNVTETEKNQKKIDSYRNYILNIINSSNENKIGV